MPRYYLEEVAIEGFRGINNENNPLTLKLSIEKINSIFAPNGTGKSSIYDALCFAIKGDIPRLQEMKQNENSKAYYLNRFHSTQEAKINIKLKDDDKGSLVRVNVSLNAAGVRTVFSPDVDNPEEILRSLDHDCTLLDYHAFNGFITSSPLDRGRSFASLVGFSKISSLKQAFDSLSSNRNTKSDFNTDVLGERIKTQEDSIRASTETISQSLAKHGGHNCDPDDKEHVENFVIEKLSEVGIFSFYLKGKDFDSVSYDQLSEIVRKAEGGDSRNELAPFIQKIETLKELLPGDVEREQNQQEQILEVLREIDEKIRDTPGENFYLLYLSAIKIFEKDNWEKSNCPLCKSRKSYDEGVTLYDEIKKDAEVYEAVRQLKKDVKSLWKNFVGRGRLLAIEDILDDSEYAYFSNLDDEFKRGTVSCSAFSNATSGIGCYYETITKEINLAEKKKEEIEQKLPSSLVDMVILVEDARSIKDHLLRRETTKEHLAKAKATLSDINRWIDFIKEASSNLEVAESDLCISISDEIESDACRLFKQITGNSNEISISLSRMANSQELNIGLPEFFNIENIHAVPVLSESYRNALAISIFLAASLRQETKAGFMVFDDITSSFDAGNQYFLMEVLKNEISVASDPNGSQLLILSHDTHLGKYFDRQESEGEKWNSIKLKGSAPSGALFAGPENAYKLKELTLKHLLEGNRIAADSLARQFLELQLSEIIRRLNILVPVDYAIRDGKKMITNSLQAIKSQIDLNKKAHQLILTDDQVQKISNIYATAIIVNLINHYETGFFEGFSHQVIRGCLQSIDALTECFKYDCNCGDTPRRRFYESLSSKARSCKC